MNEYSMPLTDIMKLLADQDNQNKIKEADIELVSLIDCGGLGCVFETNLYDVVAKVTFDMAENDLMLFLMENPQDGFVGVYGFIPLEGYSPIYGPKRYVPLILREEIDPNVPESRKKRDFIAFTDEYFEKYVRENKRDTIPFFKRYLKRKIHQDVKAIIQSLIIIRKAGLLVEDLDIGNTGIDKQGRLIVFDAMGN